MASENGSGKKPLNSEPNSTDSARDHAQKTNNPAKSCVDCPVMSCRKGGGAYSSFCLTANADEEMLDSAKAHYMT